jgi:hypothetical protein
MKNHKLLHWSNNGYKRNVCLYNEIYLSMGSTWTGDSGCPILRASTMTDDLEMQQWL